VNSIFSIARSGLEVSALRLAVSAHNVANALTSGFEPSRVEARDLAGGGVAGRVVPGEAPGADGRADGLISSLSSGTDLLGEQVRQLLAAASFRANLAALRAADELQQALVSSRG